jgi:hypothetical protein
MRRWWWVPMEEETVRSKRSCTINKWAGDEKRKIIVMQILRSLHAFLFSLSTLSTKWFWFMSGEMMRNENYDRKEFFKIFFFLSPWQIFSTFPARDFFYFLISWAQNKFQWWNNMWRNIYSCKTWHRKGATKWNFQTPCASATSGILWGACCNI